MGMIGYAHLVVIGVPMGPQSWSVVSPVASNYFLLFDAMPWRTKEPLEDQVSSGKLW